MTLSVIIPTHKRFFQVSQLIQSILNQNFCKKDLQVILVSNLKDKKLSEKSQDWDRQFEDFKYLEVGSKGVNKARNMGIRFASGKIIYFLDDDCLLPHKDHLNQLEQMHAKHTVVGIGGGYKAPEQMSGLEEFYQGQASRWLKTKSHQNETDKKFNPESQQKKQVTQLLGGNSSYKKEVFDKGFMFDARIVFGGSEESFNRLLINQNYQLLFVSSLDVFHCIQLSIFSFIKKAFLQGSGLFKNRYHSGQSLKTLVDMKKEAAFSYGEFALFPFIYNISFKFGYFWAASQYKMESFVLFQLFYFIFLIFKSLFTILKERWQWFYGQIISRFIINRVWQALGFLWFITGWLYGRVLLNLFYHSPLMKAYYFSRYQFYKRIKPLFKKRNKKHKNS